MLVASLGAGLVGSLFTFNAIPTWYATLERTVLTPPNWVFGPVWTILYILMAVAAFLVWREGAKKEKVKEALQLFGLQLALNALWSILFFGAHLILSAYVEILFLLTSIILTTIWFYRVNKTAAYLMIPYIIWVSFASILNLLTFLANR
jgi:tryptophan-rich sensory protein